MKVFSVLLQYLLPKQALTVLAGWLASAEWGRMTRATIRWFVRRYQVDMSEAAQPDIAHYASFNEFFTRSLRLGVRPLAQAAYVCPVDGAVSQLGRIEGDQIFQAKGHHYSLQTLVGGDAELAAQFQDGDFATIYLSPRDYHRVHMPSAARLRRMIHVPGDLFSVNPATVRCIPGLFARNERVVCVFELPAEEGSTPQLFVQVLVVATIVGSMATTWHGVVNPPRPGQVREWRYDQDDICFAAGDEMGRFLLGSTVVMLWPKDTIALNPKWEAGRPVRLGEAMGASVRDASCAQAW